MSTAADREVWYRVEDVRFSVADEFGDHAYTYVRVQVSEYLVIRHTAKGVWLEDGWHPPRGRRFVLRDARKRFACPTREEAFDSFRARKERQAKILRAQLKHVEDALAMVNTVDNLRSTNYLAG